MKKSLKAFTLIEVLLAVMIFGIILTSLYATFRSGLSINRRAEDVNGAANEARWFFEKITADLEQARPFNFRNSYPGALAFIGSASGISCIVPRDNGFTVVHYGLEAPERGSVYEVLIGRRTKKNVAIFSKKEEAPALNLLVREEVPFIDFLTSFPASVPPEKKEKDVLSTSIKEGSLKFSYAYWEGIGSEGRIVWKDSWEKEYIPAGVRVELTFVNPKRPQAPFKISRTIFIPTGFLGQEG